MRPLSNLKSGLVLSALLMSIIFGALLASIAAVLIALYGWKAFAAIAALCFGTAIWLIVIMANNHLDHEACVEDARGGPHIEPSKPWPRPESQIVNTTVKYPLSLDEQRDACRADIHRRLNQDKL